MATIVRTMKLLFFILALVTQGVALAITRVPTPLIPGKPFTITWTTSDKSVQNDAHFALET